MSQELKITFEPSGRTVHVLPGTILIEAAARAGLVLDTPCGGGGTCGKCRIRVTAGHCDPCADGAHLLDPADLADGIRLACQCRASEDLTLEVPETSLFNSAARILAKDTGEALDVDADGEGLGIAFDVGTTTLVGTLIELSSGRDLAVAGRMNPQTSFGDDVVSRIQACVEDPDGLERLSQSVRQGLNDIISELVATAAIDASHIHRVTLAGNTAMQQILCRIDPSALAQIPFTPAFTAPLEKTAADLGLALDPLATVFVFPQIGGFVGGDTVAGILATDLDRLTGPGLLIDVGTNGELVLCHEGRLIATSMAAGPAFEGARITHGMRATGGAIEKVLLRDDVILNVIGDQPPAGLCGTALVDAAAEMLRTGILDCMGRLLDASEVPAALPAAIRARLIDIDGQTAFVLVTADQSATGEPICLLQKDMRELQLANGAIRAGTSILLKRQGLTPDDLEVVLVAGAFGNFVRRNNARRIGMLPDLQSQRIRFVGNAASFGAKHALLSKAECLRAAAIEEKTEHIDLSADTQFQMEFSEAMIFPDH